MRRIWLIRRMKVKTPTPCCQTLSRPSRAAASSTGISSISASCWHCLLLSLTAFWRPQYILSSLIGERLHGGKAFWHFWWLPCGFRWQSLVFCAVSLSWGKGSSPDVFGRKERIYYFRSHSRHSTKVIAWYEAATRRKLCTIVQAPWTRGDAEIFQRSKTTYYRSIFFSMWWDACLLPWTKSGGWLSGFTAYGKRMQNSIFHHTTTS